MFKRAYLYSCNVPITNQPNGSNSDAEYDSGNAEGSLNVDGYIIKLKPGSHVAYCKYCKGKLLLNNDSIDKHIKSKNHNKNINRYKIEQSNRDRIKAEFSERMESIDKSV